MAEEELALWEVVGGEDKGGLLVRVGKRLATEPLPELLSVGSIVKQLALSGNRLHYRLLAGTGPEEGWVSLSLKQNRVLLEERTREQANERIRALQTSAPSIEKQEPEAEELPSDSEEPGEGNEEDKELVNPDGGNEEPREAQPPCAATPNPAGEGLDAELPQPTEQSECRPPPPRKSEVREDQVPTTPEAWAELFRRKDESGLKEEAGRILQNAADSMLQSGLFEDAIRFAKDALRHWERLGGKVRVPLGIAFHTIAKIKMELYNSLEAAEVAYVIHLCQDAAEAAHSACGMLRTIEDPEEEIYLASARHTLQKARELVDALLKPLPDDYEEEPLDWNQDWNQQPQPQKQPQEGPEIDHHCHKAVAEQLLSSARAVLKKGMAENASELAREAVEQFRHAGSRWKQGIAWDVHARTQLELFKGAHDLLQSGKGSHATLQTARQHREGALASSCKAVALLCAIGHPQEEEDFTAAQKTFDEVAKLFCAGDEGLLAQTLLTSAEALFRDGKARGALELATAAVEHYRGIAAAGQHGCDGLSKAHETLAKIRLRLLNQDFAVAETVPGAEAFGIDYLDKSYQLAASAAREAVKVLEEPAASRPELVLPLAAARCTWIRVRGSEPRGRISRSQQQQDRLNWDYARLESKGDREALAHRIKETALRHLMDGSCGEAREVALAAATYYQELGMNRQVGIALDLLSNAYLETISRLEGSREGKAIIPELAREALGCARGAVENLEAADNNEAWKKVLKFARSTVDRAEAMMSGTGASRGQRGGLTAMEAKIWPLKHSFAYVRGLEKPLGFARFDVRPEVCEHIGGFRHGQEVVDKDGNRFIVVGVKADHWRISVPQMWFQPKNLGFKASCCFKGLEAPALTAVLSVVEGRAEPLEEASLEDHDAAEDSDHEVRDLCHECLLPLGVSRYPSANADGWVHGECMAQILLDMAKSQDKTRLEKLMQQKALDRDEYKIGWKPGRMISSNKDFLEEHKLQCSCGPASSFMYTLVLGGSSPPSVRLLQTNDPEGAVNVAYLVTALQVRSRAGVAPYFSLDIPTADELWQVKTFGPPWLRGTCMGEVLFQADFHLKELSMGEAEQPVAGMRSVWDYPWLQEEWRGREWFVVRDATVQISDSNVLVPKVSMGVEARQQVATENNALVDVPVTSKEHPLVKYAEVFTENFDLIAERKSVFYQLREVTKASILAKFLLNNKVLFDEQWLQATEQPCHCKLDIPFNNLERSYYHVLVSDGVIKEQRAGGHHASCKGVYGGVDLNIDAFDLSMPDVLPKQLEQHDHAAPQPRAPDLSTLSQRELRQRIQQAGGQLPRGPAEKSHLIELLTELERKVEAPSAKGPPEDEQTKRKAQPLMGEEEALLKEELRRLSLTEDLLNAVVLAARRARERASSGFPRSAEALINSFWDSLKSDSELEHAQLLRAIFQTRMCDRSQDGDLFTPPVMTPSYLSSLQQIVDKEKKLQDQRKCHFLSKDFVQTAPGSLFPTSWAQVFSISYARGSSVAAGGSAARGRRLQHSKADPAVVMRGRPVFDKTTEDGVRFRVYRQGLQEVRTLQEGSDDERVAAVFEQSAAPKPREHDPVVKATQFVCSSQASADTADYMRPAASKGKDPGATRSELFRYFVVYETDLGDSILTERLPSGDFSWEENPLDLEDLCVQARVVCAMDCATSGLTVTDVREGRRRAPTGKWTSSRKYAEWAITEVHGTLLCGDGRRSHQLVVPPPIEG